MLFSQPYLSEKRTDYRLKSRSIMKKYPLRILSEKMDAHAYLCHHAE